MFFYFIGVKRDIYSDPPEILDNLLGKLMN